ncbi:MAG: hypothetical protein D8M61_14450 [Ignavibacteriae bacterium]|nr:hypothetical protein [Ignavibacteriota bacterium]
MIFLYSFYKQSLFIHIYNYKSCKCQCSENSTRKEVNTKYCREPMRF